MARAKRICTECENELKRFDKICPFCGKNTAPKKILVNKTLKKLFKEDKKIKRGTI